MLLPYHPVKKSKMPTVGHAVSKWHSKLLARLKGQLSPNRLAIHSYRHVVISRLHALEVSHVMNLAIVGHSGKGVNVSVYGHVQTIPLATLKKHLDRIVLPSVKG